MAAAAEPVAHPIYERRRALETANGGAGHCGYIRCCRMGISSTDPHTWFLDPEAATLVSQALILMWGLTVLRYKHLYSVQC